MNAERGTRNPEFAFIALGSNLGDSAQILRDAMARLQEFSDAPLEKSSWGKPRRSIARPARPCL